MKTFDEIKQFLPKYLSEEGTQNLFQSLKDFPDNIHKRLYTNVLENEAELFQGDGLRRMLIVRLPEPSVIRGPVMIISNTCDVYGLNARSLSPKLIYCPIVKLSGYKQNLKQAGIDVGRISTIVETIVRQSMSNVFFLPKGGNLPEDCLAMLDEINSCDIRFFDNESKKIAIRERRLFSLSDYGFYIFLFKLSIHFTRIREAVRRS